LKATQRQLGYISKLLKYDRSIGVPDGDMDRIQASAIIQHLLKKKDEYDDMSRELENSIQDLVNKFTGW